MQVASPLAAYRQRSELSHYHLLLLISAGHDKEHLPSSSTSLPWSQQRHIRKERRQGYPPELLSDGYPQAGVNRHPRHAISTLALGLELWFWVVILQVTYLHSTEYTWYPLWTTPVSTQPDLVSFLSLLRPLSWALGLLGSWFPFPSLPESSAAPKVLHGVAVWGARHRQRSVFALSGALLCQWPPGDRHPATK